MSRTEWLKLPADELLLEFGAGSHKPGSGSAAALVGMLSAQLKKTVIKLTCDPKRSAQYQEALSVLRKIDSEIDRIYDRLLILFQQDSDQWGQVVQLREARDKEIDPTRKGDLGKQALRAQITATETLIEIADLTVKLAGFALVVFDYGYRAASGDSSVALHCAVAALGACISIVDLNLLSFESDEWAEKILRKVDKLRAELEMLLEDSRKRREVLKDKIDRHTAYHLALKELRTGRWENASPSYADIEEFVTDIQNTLWEYRDKIWKKDPPDLPMQVLRPDIVLRLLGYGYYEVDTLGEHEVDGNLFEIAGEINKQNQTVAVSKRFSKEIQRFTAAHELGHCLLHAGITLHRDRPLDGSRRSSSRDIREQEADWFSAFFLMPRKPIQQLFQKMFRTDEFVLNDNTAFALRPGQTTQLRAECQDLRSLSRILASAEQYDGVHFNSLASIFGVSVEAMAIRLEELGLVTM